MYSMTPSTVLLLWALMPYHDKLAQIVADNLAVQQ